jgi:tetratricopeptide (TPR) repeat protein
VSRRIVAPLFLLLWLAGTFLPSWYEEKLLPPVEKRSRIDVLLDVLGESRTILARYLFMKADVYHHVLEKQGVYSTKEQDVLPLYRLCTYLDPRMEEAFDLLVYDLNTGYGDQASALAVLEEGLLYTPKSVKLNLRKAQIFLLAKEYEKAIPAAQLAVENSTDEFDTRNSLRVLYHSYEHLQRWKDAERVLMLHLEIAPADPNAPRQLKMVREKLAEQGTHE